MEQLSRLERSSVHLGTVTVLCFVGGHANFLCPRILRNQMIPDPPHATQTPPMQLRADLAVAVSGQESNPSLVSIGKYNRSWSRGVEIRPPPCSADPPHAKSEDFL